MVDRVGNGPGYGYPQINEKRVNTNVAGTGEKFQLDYGKEGAIYEPSSEALKKQQAEKGAPTKTQEPADLEDKGVRLTLSGTAQEHTKIADREINTTGGGILDAVTDIFNKVIDTIKSFFSSIWNDEPTIRDISKSEAPDMQKADDESKELIADASKTERPKTRFEEAKAEAEAFLASSESKRVAKNSDLLTYYDKHGTVVSVSPSDRQRILYGDKNQIEV